MSREASRAPEDTYLPTYLTDANHGFTKRCTQHSGIDQKVRDSRCKHLMMLPTDKPLGFCNGPIAAKHLNFVSKSRPHLYLCPQSNVLLIHVVIVELICESTVNMVTKTLCNTQKSSLRIFYRTHAYTMCKMQSPCYLIIINYSVVLLSVLCRNSVCTL